MLESVLAIVVGFALLVWGADRFVAGASGIARHLGVSPLIIGLTIVGFGTSAPEVLVSAVAAFEGNRGLGVGNALGSNIANVALVVGATALVMPLLVQSNVLRREFPVLLVTMFAVLALLWDKELSRIDGVLLISGMIVMIVLVVRIGQKSQVDDPLAAEFNLEIPPPLKMSYSAAWFALGLVTLLVSSQALVWGASNVAQAMGISDLVIGLTIVAIGTSLPELAASIMGALKNEHDIAIGNIIGSNMFNILAVMAMPGLIEPGAIEPQVLSRDYPLMLVLTLALWAMAHGMHGRPGKVTRTEGGFLLAAYISYLVWLYMTEVA